MLDILSTLMVAHPWQYSIVRYNCVVLLPSGVFNECTGWPPKSKLLIIIVDYYSLKNLQGSVVTQTVLGGLTIKSVCYQQTFIFFGKYPL